MSGTPEIVEAKRTITIPDDVEFSDLRLSRDLSGAVEFDWTPIERICEASSLDISVFRERHEDNVAGLISAWYVEHLKRGGARDPVQDAIIAEAMSELN